MKVVCVTGSVCSGKTTVSKKLAEELGYSYVDVNKIIESNPEVVETFNRDLDTKEIDTDKLVKVLGKEVTKDSVVDSHLSHFFKADLCIVLKCDLKILKKRLEERGYKENKIEENMDAEIMDSCLMEALELGQDVIVIDTTDGVDYGMLVALVKEKCIPK